MAVVLMKLISSSEILSEIPYTFELTGINVYSIEEVLWHIFNYLEKSLNIFEDNAFFQWAENQIGLKKEVKAFINNKKELNEKIIDFISFFNYLSQKEIDELRQRLYALSEVDSFESQKEIGDLFYKNGKYQQAVYAYSKALELDREKEELIKNNIGLCCLQARDYENSVSFFEEAYEKSKKPTILLNLIQGLILNGGYSRAEKLLSQYSGEDIFNLAYLKAMLFLAKAEYNNCILALKQCLEIKKDFSVVMKISDILIRQRKFEEAIAFLESLEEKDATVYVKLAEIYCAEENYSLGIKAVQRGLIYYMNDVRLWIKLAKCYRLNLDFLRADGAICKAKMLEENNIEVNLEFAKIRKCQGRMNDYRDYLGKGLSIIKNNYFENHQN